MEERRAGNDQSHWLKSISRLCSASMVIAETGRILLYQIVWHWVERGIAARARRRGGDIGSVCSASPRFVSLRETAPLVIRFDDPPVSASSVEKPFSFHSASPPISARLHLSGNAY